VKPGASQCQSFPTSARARAGIAREAAAAGESKRKQLLAAADPMTPLTPWHLHSTAVIRFVES
jgi:hypothetical protein